MPKLPVGQQRELLNVLPYAKTPEQRSADLAMSKEYDNIFLVSEDVTDEHNTIHNLDYVLRYVSSIQPKKEAIDVYWRCNDAYVSRATIYFSDQTWCSIFCITSQKYKAQKNKQELHKGLARVVYSERVQKIGMYSEAKNTEDKTT